MFWWQVELRCMVSMWNYHLDVVQEACGSMWYHLCCCHCCDNVDMIMRWIFIHIMITCWVEIRSFSVETTMWFLYMNRTVRCDTVNYCWSVVMMHSFIHASYIVVVGGGERIGLRVSVRGLVTVPSMVWGLELGVGFMGPEYGIPFIKRIIIEVGTACIWVYNVVERHIAYWSCILVKWVKLEYMCYGAWWIMCELYCI